MLEEDDDMLTKRALEDGALLCIKKPITVDTVRYFWQLVLWEETRRKREEQRYARELIMSSNNGVGEFNNYYITQNANSEESSYYEGGAISLRNKVWTEWTQELHDKFMAAIRSLGTGSM